MFLDDRVELFKLGHTRTDLFGDRVPVSAPFGISLHWGMEGVVEQVALHWDNLLA